MKRLLVASCCLLLAACTSMPSHPQDPLEPMNRVIFRFNDSADRAILRPVAEGYRYITPRPVRTGVGNFFDNLRDVYSVVNNTAQGNIQLALTDVLRVSFNSTFGLFGLIDIATPMGLKSSKATLGDTLAHYGWRNSTYLVLPFMGPSTVRDATGMALTMAAEPDTGVFATHTQYNSARVLNAINTRERLLGLEDVVNGAALDNYSYIRDGFLQVRDHQLGIQPNEQTLQEQQDELNIDELVDAPTDSAAPSGSSPAASQDSPPADASAPASVAP